MIKIYFLGYILTAIYARKIIQLHPQLSHPVIVIFYFIFFRFKSRFYKIKKINIENKK